MTMTRPNILLIVTDEERRRLESLIDAEIGTDTRAWVTERPRLLGWPTWKGDALSPAPA